MQRQKNYKESLHQWSDSNLSKLKEELEWLLSTSTLYKRYQDDMLSGFTEAHDIIMGPLGENTIGSVLDNQRCVGALNIYQELDEYFVKLLSDVNIELKNRITDENTLPD